MDFVQHDHVVQAFTTDGTDDSLSVGILPGRSWRSRNFANLHAFHAAFEVVAEDAVAISKKKARRFFVGESVDDLLRSPFGIGMRRDVEVNDLSPIVPEYDDNVEHSKGSTRKVDVGTVKKSYAAMSGMGLRRNVCQVCEGGWRVRTMYLATVRSATSCPKRSNSEQIRGAPQPGFSRDIFWINSRTSQGMGGRPGSPHRDFQRQNNVKPCRCQRMTVSGCTTQSADRQLDQSRDRHTQKIRSRGRNFGRFTDCLYTASCCRSARFSVANLDRATSSDRMTRRPALIKPMRAPEIVHSSRGADTERE